MPKPTFVEQLDNANDKEVAEKAAQALNEYMSRLVRGARFEDLTKTFDEIISEPEELKAQLADWVNS